MKEFQRQENPVPGKTLYDVWGSGSDDVFAVGSSGTILHYDGLGWASMSSGTNDDLQSVWGSGSHSVYAVGDNGTVLHYDGSSWSRLDTGNGMNFYGIWGSRTNEIFVVGDYGAILRYDGQGWTKTTSLTSLGEAIDHFDRDKQRQVRALANRIGVGRVDYVGVEVSAAAAIVRWLPGVC